MPLEDITSASFHIQRWENLRVLPPAVLLGSIAVLGSFAIPMVGIVSGMGFLVVMGLHMKWGRDAKRIAEHAVRLADHYSVQFTDSSLSFSQNGEKSTFPWNKIAYVTRATNAWVVVPGDPRQAFMVPFGALSPSQTDEFTKLMSGWPKRKYRTARLPRV